MAIFQVTQIYYSSLHQYSLIQQIFSVCRASDTMCNNGYESKIYYGFDLFSNSEKEDRSKYGEI